MKTIRLVVFNEEFWGKGLIYSQNILPLLSLKKEKGINVEIVSFTSIAMMLKKRHIIKESRRLLKEKGVIVREFPVLYYPTRFLLPYWYILPYFYLNMFIYILWLRLMDAGKDVQYNLRSYQPALAFYSLYGHKERLVFDPRTDFVEEKMNAGHFKEGGWTMRFWRNMEGRFIRNFKKTIVISDTFRDNLIKKHNLKDVSRIVILYNPINYSHFLRKKETHSGSIFLYTGSIGGWNKLENYLSLYLIFHKRNLNSRFIICTSAAREKIEAVITLPEYTEISNSIEVHYNVPYEELPGIYAQCDYGFQIMKKKDSRVGVKFIEYVSAGVVPIINNNVQGAAVLAERYNMGVILNDDDSEEQICEKIMNAKPIDRESVEYLKFKSLTDTANIAERLEKIYFDGTL